jgi:hypothetical protein
MLRFASINKYPDYISRERLHLIATRQSIFGVHLPHRIAKDLDPQCTKTHLLAFLKYDDARNFKIMLENYKQYHNNYPDRVLDGSVPIYGSHVALPIGIEDFAAADIERLCQINWFSLLVVFNVIESDDPLDDIYNCYTLHTQPPERNVVNSYFKNLLP